MKRFTALVLVSVMMLSLLTGCGKKKNKDIELQIAESTSQPGDITAEETPVIPSTPKISQQYNSLDEGDQTEIAQVLRELESVASACREIYEPADKGTAMNVVLGSDTVRAMVDRIGSLGYAAVDYAGNLDMRCPEAIEYFGTTIDGPNDTSVSYYMVYPDGQISVYHLGRLNGLWYLIAMSCGWDKNCKPTVMGQGRYVVGGVKYTDKGWLIYSRDTDSFDDNQRSNTNAYVFIRVRPYDATKKALCEKYIKPVGYFENNLFTTTWTQANLAPIDFNSLFSALFGMYNGTDALSASNMENYYTSVKNTRLALIPTDSFERIVQHYFAVDPTLLKAVSDYSPTLGGYYFYGYSDGIYNVTPRIPEPEVTDYWYNSDGSLTMRVDAVYKWYGTDRAFSHDVTVMDTSDGFHYVANTLYTDENSILPSCKISSLLDIELEKLS
ncbi:MAG: DUF6070 family protein [Eubacteriales bacterium]|nr:DUF6070 family protein [Eubacteriales bacterium]